MHSDSVTPGLDDDDKGGAPNTRPSFLETGHKTIRVKVPLTQCSALRIYLTQVGADNPDLHYREAVDGEVHDFTITGNVVLINFLQKVIDHWITEVETEIRQRREEQRLQHAAQQEAFVRDIRRASKWVALLVAALYLALIAINSLT